MFWSFLGPKWHSPIGLIPFHRAQKTLEFQGPTPSHLPKQWICTHPKHYAQGCINHMCIGGFMHKSPQGRFQGPYWGGWRSRCIKELVCPARAAPPRDNCKVHNMRHRGINYLCKDVWQSNTFPPLPLFPSWSVSISLQTSNRYTPPRTSVFLSWLFPLLLLFFCLFCYPHSISSHFHSLIDFFNPPLAWLILKGSSSF